MNLPFVTILRESVRLVRREHLFSAALGAVAVSMVVAILATAGQGLASRAQILLTLESPSARMITITDTAGSANITPAVVGDLLQVSRVAGVIGLSEPVDVRNASIPDGPSGSIRSVVGSFAMTGLPPDASVGSLYLSSGAAELMGMTDGAGALVDSDGVELEVSDNFSPPAWLPLLSESTLRPELTTAPGLHMQKIIVEAKTAGDVDTLVATLRTILMPSDPASLSVESATILASLSERIGSDLSDASRRLVVYIFWLPARLRYPS